MSQSPDTASDARAVQLSFAVALPLTAVALLIVACFTILKPFVLIMLWAVILAVALEGVFNKLLRMVGGRRGMAASLLSLISIGLIVYPSYQIGGSLVGSVNVIRADLEDGTLQLPPPPESLKSIPLVGDQVHATWILASENTRAAAVQYQDQLRSLARWVLGFLAGMAGTVVTTMLALVVAGIMLTHAEAGVGTLRATARRVQGDWDEDLVGMAGATIKSVATGVLGVALTQAALCGLGLFVAGVPAAGLITIACLVLAIVQLPPIIALLLPIIWGFGNLGGVWAVVFAIYCVAASSSDIPLKAMFLGRGVSVPTAVILLGAIGGMVTIGMMGLFLGAVILAVGYQLYQAWLNPGDMPAAEAAA